MSAAIDEADLGPELHTSDIESDWDDQEAPKEHEVRKNVTKRPTEQFAEEEETANSVVPNLNGYDASQEQDDGMGNTKQSPPPVIVERPSSADGSLSIPNDTPSIQVRHCTLSSDLALR